MPGSITRKRATASTAIRRPTTPSRTPTNTERTTLLAAYGGVNVSLWAGRFTNRFAVQHSDSNRKTFDPTLSPAEDFFAKGDATRFEYQGVFDWAGEFVLRRGKRNADPFDPEHLRPAAPTKGSDRINGYYVQWQTKPLESLTLTGGVRHDDDKEFGGHNSVKLSGAWQVLEATTLRANYGDGFKAPSLYELFSQYSNPLAGLKPEIAKGWEAGVDQSLWDGRLSASLTYFERRTADQIDFFSCYGVTSPACALRAAQGGYYYNVDRSHASGVEAELIRAAESIR